MQASSTLAAMQAADALRATGATVFDFGAGEPDFDTPENIKRAAADAMQAGKTKYTPTGGTRELQQAIINFYGRESEEFARRLLEDEQTVVTDGFGFGAAGHIRKSYATSTEHLTEGVMRLKRCGEAQLAFERGTGP